MNARQDLLYCYGAFSMLFYQEGLSGYAYNHQRFQRTPWLNILCALRSGRDCIFGSQDISAARWIPEAEDAGGFMGAKRRVLLGFPGDRLADLADDEAAELIIVGSRGRGAVKSALLGSVSADVIGVARRPVLVVPSRADVPSRERGEARGASLARAT